VSGQSIAERVAAVRERIARAAARAGRDPAGITLVGVTKRKPAEAIVEGVRAGVVAAGENYVQEAVAKIPEVLEKLAGAPAPRWHFIGRLQRNKARHVAPLFDVIETVDRAALGEALERRAASLDRTLDVLLQVDLCDEPQKGGVAPEALPALLAASHDWPHLRVTGLMTIPALEEDPERTRPVFARLRTLHEALAGSPDGAGLRELSMGMSSDFEVAIEEGATIIRVGTALYGPRDA
jgi:pyridoxal phosphate enzyme (YggS family)